MGRRLCILGFCRSIEMLSDVVEDTVLEHGGEVCIRFFGIILAPAHLCALNIKLNKNLKQVLYRLQNHLSFAFQPQNLVLPNEKGFPHDSHLILYVFWNLKFFNYVFLI